MRTGELLLNQSKKLLDNKQQAFIGVALLAILPFASWLSVALVALVTLRKGLKPGFELLFPAMVVHSVPLMMLMPVESALVNTLITYIPCFLAALCLRKTASWQKVCGLFFLLTLAVFSFINASLPHFAVFQLAQFNKILSHYQEYQLYFKQATEGVNSKDLAQLFIGIQVLSAVLSAMLSLLFARFIQAKLFVPGGLKAELSLFRASRFAFFLLMLVAIGSYYGYAIAVNLLPLTLSYFFLSGFNLAYCISAKKARFRMAFLLLIIMIQPALMLFAYILLGSLDSLFNFRLYLPERARESI